jgi:hypothetical protein
MDETRDTTTVIGHTSALDNAFQLDTGKDTWHIREESYSRHLPKLTRAGKFLSKEHATNAAQMAHP